MLSWEPQPTWGLGFTGPVDRSFEFSIHLFVLQIEIQDNKKKERKILSSLKDSGNELRQVFVAKQKLMVDVGAILRTIDKSADFELPEVTRYLKRYRDFSDLISNLVKDTTTDELNEDMANACIDKIEVANDTIPVIYDELVSFPFVQCHNVLSF